MTFPSLKRASVIDPRSFASEDESSGKNSGEKSLSVRGSKLRFECRSLPWIMRNNSRRFLILIGLVIFLLIATRLFAGRSFLISVETFHRFGTDYVGVPLQSLQQQQQQQQQKQQRQQQDNSRSAPAYAPGTYMAGRQPENVTSCSWYYGLPMILAYPANRVIGSPEADKRGPYRVLPFAIRGNSRDRRNVELPNLTLCTHATADQIYNVVEIVRRWEGAVSLAIFAPGLDAALAVALLERACRCEPEMAKVSVHLVFPAGRPPALSTMIQEHSRGDCAASDLQLGESNTERKQRGMTYPINVARNVARNFSPTIRVLVSDIELLPSERLASGFLEMIHERSPRAGVVFVVPTFEIHSHERPPSNKRQLMAALRNGLAVYFHRFVCIHCQRFPGITRWMLRPDPGTVRPLIVTKREYPYHRWEPVFIGTRDDPMYNEEMSWEGRQDKMAQMLEMCLMNYRLIILDGAFLVHTPGIKHKPSRINMKNEIYGPDRVQEKRNARIYLSLTRRLLKQYPINRRCKQ